MDAVLRLNDIGMAFGSNQVLHSVNLELHPGEVHVLAGGNGAGKSTLINVIGGNLPSYSGTVELAGNRVHFRDPLSARRSGISIIHQELSLVPTLSVLENLFLGEMPCRWGLVNWAAMEAEARSVMAKIGVSVDLHRPVGELPISTQQLLEIGKAVKQEAKVMIMDEPTSALNTQEAERLFGLVRDLKTAGCAILYVSHRMEEYRQIADRISVLTDGRIVSSRPAQEFSPEEIASLMIRSEDRQGSEDRNVQEHASTPKESMGSKVTLTVTQATSTKRGKRVVDGVDLSVQGGEVLGIAGLEGCGASELLWTLFGADPREPGTRIELNGTVLTGDPSAAIAAGMGLVTNDRKATGLYLRASITDNIIMPSLSKFSRAGMLSRAETNKAAAELCQLFSVVTSGLDAEVGSLSGGNQQKVVLAKWHLTHPQVLLLDEPTRGIDVNAKQAIYRQIEDWKRSGMAIVMVSSDIHELLLLADRVLVMRSGKVTAELDRQVATPDLVIQAAAQA